MKTTLCVKDLSYTYGEKLIIDNLNLTLNEGEVIIITGKNGVGKTTLLRLMSGILPIKSGSITFNGESIEESGNEYKHSMAYLGHNSGFYDELTVGQNLEFWAGLRDSYELILPSVYFFGLVEVIDKLYAKLSAGWKKRVAFARMMISDATIWLLDEPFINLDTSMQELVSKLLQTRAQQNGIVVITTHIKLDIENARYLNLDKI